jgi:hypothetical protein
MKKTFSLPLLPALLFVIIAISISSAEIPAGYAGLPFPPGSAPRELMGRINFNEFDCGAINVSFFADDAWDGAPNRNKVGQTAGPAFYCTNGGSWDLDTFYANGVMWPSGVRYPNPIDTTEQDCYIGASHPSNWTKWTVHVAKAQKLWISAYWCAMDANMIFTVSCLNGTKTATTGQITLHTVTQSYHAWRRFPDFASIQVDTGVQVLYFQNGSMHLNQDYLFFSADSGQFPTITTGILQPSLNPAKTESPAISISQNKVRFTLKNAGMTKVSIFNCLGREIVPVLEKNLSAGDHSVTFNAASLKQGVYFLHITHSGNTSVLRFHTIAR